VSDILVRYSRLRGAETYFLTGSDENTQKMVDAARKAGQEPLQFLDEIVANFKNLFGELGISYDQFIRTTDQIVHWPGAQAIWQKLVQAGDIYKKSYTGWYCVGCEAFYAEADLVNGQCPEHLKPLEQITEENYFFRLSKYEARIRALIESDAVRITSDTYKNEMLGFIKRGLEDFSVSRDAVRGRGIGVPIPGDTSQVMYVWFDALAIYLTGNGWGYDAAQFSHNWPADAHVIGKGINRFHSVYWIGMLLSAGLPLPKSVCVHGYITINGQKMSKSLGNVLDPYDLVAQYGLEPLRYYLLKEIPTHNDGDFGTARFAEVYRADLANGIGNVCSRIAKLCATHTVALPHTADKAPQPYDAPYADAFSQHTIDQAAHHVKRLVAECDQFLNEQHPWTLKNVTQHEARTNILQECLRRIVHIARHLTPIMPTTANAISTHFTAPTITPLQPLFPQLADA
jgi:methionyl-tRNA synthetase